MADEIKDILAKTKQDRRLLSHVPDSEGVRTNIDRRGNHFSDKDLSDIEKNIKVYQTGMRYLVNYDVEVDCGSSSFTATAVDISSSGILLKVDKKYADELRDHDDVRMKFTITQGTMPEGFEMDVDIKGKCMRVSDRADDENAVDCGLQFHETLVEYATRTKNRYTLPVVAMCMFFVIFMIVMMRTESVLYFKFNKWLYLYSIIAATFLLSRYFFASRYRPYPIDKNYTPGVTIIIPCFNEETWISRTILSCINQDYPVDKLEVIVVDDCSNDRSLEVIKATIEEIASKEGRYDIANRLHYIKQPKNMGKREAMAAGAQIAKHDLLVFVDSDSFLDPFAIYNIVQPFKDKDMGGVSGRTDVANTYTNALTKMQAVRYYISFRIMKAAEGYFDAVTCLSGPLSCYRKDLVLKNLDKWLHQTFLGQRATFGDDRAMTNFILSEHRTTYQDTAVCATIVPNQYDVFLRQQMRWKRSWLRESINASRFMWKKEPFMSLGFYMGVLVPIMAPIIVLYNLVYVPIAYRVLPYTFILGMILMSLMMSFSQKYLRKSSTWLYAIWFCLYYEAVLLWQMPIAWFTFWKSTWGTRATPADLREQEKKDKRKTENKL